MNRKISATCLVFLIVALSPTSFNQNLEDNLESVDSSVGNPEILEMIQQVNESTLKKHVQIIQDFGPHPTGSEACDGVRDYIYTELTNTDLSVRYDNWNLNGKKGKNIEATLPGIGSSDGIVVVCAHYDSVVVSPGADDDGSGVAAVLAMAEIMSRYEFNSTVKFVLFSGEEQGRLGSQEYVKEAYEKGDKIIGAVNLDGIGYAVSVEDGSKIKNLVNKKSTWIVDISKEINNLYDEYIDLNIICCPNEPIGDHQSFLDYGYDTSYFLEYTLNPYYHTSEDKIEYMNITYLMKVCRLTIGTLNSMANLNRVISEEDLKIEFKGTILSHPAQFCIRIENNKYKEDTANLTIKIEMKNIFTGEYVKGPYNTTCNWSFSKEIGEYWEFKTASRSYNLEPFMLEVTVDGFNDDIGLHKKKQTFGIVFSIFVIMIPAL